jgi:hypothetical protein
MSNMLKGNGLALMVGLACASLLTGCTADPNGGTPSGTSGKSGTGGSGSGGNGSGGSPVSGSGGGGGQMTDAGGGAGGSGGTVGGTGGVGGSDAGGGIDTAQEVPTVPCPGAGKALHFEDDLMGRATRSMQLTADLGADLPIGNTARTIEMWLYMNGNESWKAEHSIVEYGGTGRCQAFGIDGGDNATRDPPTFDPFTFSAGGPCSGDDNVALTPAPPRTGWLHLAWVYDPTGKLSYGGMDSLNFMFTINGVAQPIPAKKQTGMLLTTKTPVIIGAGQGTNNGFTGNMDELRFWNVARTEKEIADNYKMILKGDEPGLIAYYHFDDGTGMTAKDASSKQHDAMFATDMARPVPTWVDSTGLTLTCKP